MTQNLTELCSLLVRDIYGGLTATVFQTLSQCTRITLATLMHRCDISKRHVRHALVVLIQQHLILYSAPDGDAATLYEVNWPAAYALVRYGKFVALIEERYNRGFARIIHQLLFYGQTSIKDLEAGFFDFDGNTSWALDGTSESLTNGCAASQTTSATDELHDSHQFHTALHKLMQAGFVTCVRQRNFRPLADLQNEVEDYVTENYFEQGKTTGPKVRLQYNQRLLETKRKWREEDEALPDDIIETAPDQGRPAKRLKTNGMTNGASSNGQQLKLKGDYVIRANLDKCCVAMRTLKLETFACRYCDPVTARVYGVLLRLFEPGISVCRDDWLGVENMTSQPAITSIEVTDLLDEIDPSLDLTSCLFDDTDELAQGDVDQDTHANGIDSESISANRAKHRRVRYVDQHLRMLAEHPLKFLQTVGSRGGGEWNVEFRALTAAMQSSQVENVLTARFNYKATRIVRLLRDKKGRLDEKLISNYALIPRKEVRSTLAPMQEAGLIDTQEIPRDTSRQPNRATYLWFFDQDRVMRLLLADTYKAMARILQRTAHQRSLYKAVLEKADREDVRQDPAKLLTPAEHRRLDEWSELEEKLLTQLMRQDDLVALFRDF